MSVRIAYLERAQRGIAIRSVRLAGQGTEERWAAPQGEDSPERTIAQAARWIASSLSGTRAAGRLEWLCLDTVGGVCAWISSPSAEPQVVATLARMGAVPAGDDALGARTTPHSGPIEFFAQDPLDSLIQPMGVAVAEQPARATSSRARSRKGEQAAVPERLAILAQADLPARVLADELDALGVTIGSTLSLWHAIAAAWDPASTLNAAPRSESTIPEPPSPLAIVVVDPSRADAPRLVWAWSLAGRLLAGGEMRLARADEDHVHLDDAEISRLSMDFTSWSMQLGVAPKRLVAVAPHHVARPLMDGLSRAWPGSAGQVAADEDPIGATLSRLAGALERTPMPHSTLPDPAAELVSLASRPGKAHRQMYRWLALLATIVAGVLGVWAWQARARAIAASAEAGQVVLDTNDAIAKEFPEFANRVDPKSKLIDDAISRAKKQLTIPKGPRPALPILQELETITLVLGSGDFSLERLEVYSTYATVWVSAESLPAVEPVPNALRNIAGSQIVWGQETISEERQGATGKKFVCKLVGSWPATSEPRP